MSLGGELICVSGWAQRGESFFALEEHLSDYCSVQTTSVYELVEDFAPETEALEQNFSPLGPSIYAERLSQRLTAEDPGILIAWSMGGLVALETAFYFPQRVKKLVLIGSTSCFCSKKDALGTYRVGVSQMNLRGMALGLRRAPQFTLMMFFRKLYEPDCDESLVKEKVNQAVELDQNVLQHGLRYLEKTDLRMLLGELEQEVLVLHGEQDGVISWEAGEYLAEHLACSRLRVFEGGSHALAEQSPGLLAAEIRNFVA